jgi:hypothetical protein
MKLKLTAVALLLLGAAGCRAQTVTLTNDGPGPRISRDNAIAIAQQYNDLNEQYMLGQLPEVVIVIADHVAVSSVPDDVMGFTVCPRGNKKPCTIYLGLDANGYGMRSLKFTLEHEACHVKTYGHGHDEVWQHCMFDLASKGAFHDLW